ncbi:MAG: AraC family transcriptional regulator [Paenibacillus sp.]|nr:AraC family transcriptional regulator [Paenibacillus sp.]
MRLKNPNLLHEHTVIINHAVDYIDEHVAGELTLQNIASVAAVSPHYFHRMFKSIVQETVGEYIVRRRLEIAVHYLLLLRRQQRNLATSGSLYQVKQACFVERVMEKRHPTHGYTEVSLVRRPSGQCSL